MSPEQKVSVTKRLRGKNSSILYFEEGKICMCVHKEENPPVLLCTGIQKLLYQKVYEAHYLILTVLGLT
jgi:hypothetical protein